MSGKVFTTLQALDHFATGYAPWEYFYFDAVLSMEKWRGGLTASSVTDLNTLFAYCRNQYDLFNQNMPASLYYVGMYDMQYGTVSGEGNIANYANNYTTLGAVFTASAYGSTSPPYPSGGGIYEPNNASHIVDDPKLVSTYAVISQMAIKMRAIADPSNAAMATMLTDLSTEIANKTGVSAANGGMSWSYIDGGGVRQNYPVYGVW